MRARLGLIPLAVGTALVLALPTAALAKPTRTGTETFTSTQDINIPGGPVVASGVINATGTDIVVSDTEDTFDFGANGQITVSHSPRQQTQHFKAKTCTFSFTEKGTYVFGNGTGEWTSYNGSGRYTVTGVGVSPKNPDGTCSDSSVGTLTINATGPINLSTGD